MAGAKFDSKSFNPQAFGAYTERIPNLKRNELIKSRALKGNQDIKNTFSSQTGTSYATLPMHGLIGELHRIMMARPILHRTAQIHSKEVLL